MLHQGKYFIVLCNCLLIFSCNKTNSLDEERSIIDSISSIRESIEIINMAKDSIFSWSKAKIPNSLSVNGYGKYWIIDKTIAFNEAKNRTIMAMLYSNGDINTTMDGLEFLYGAKIDNVWYFFYGATIYLPRENYQKDASKPLSFSKLHEIAMQEVFSGYLVRKKKDAGFWKNIFAPEYEYEVNERFFEQMENKNQDGTYLGFKTFEEAVLWQVKLNWKKK